MKKPPRTDRIVKAIKRASRARTARAKALSVGAVQLASIRAAKSDTLQVVARHLKDTGLDLRKIKSIQQRLGAEIARAAAQQKAAAIRAASAQRKRVSSGIAQRAKAVSALATGPALNINPFVVLDTPILIWAQPLLGFSDTNTAPFDSWIKFDLSASRGESTQAINFYFYWQSLFDAPVTINAQTVLSAVGHLQANAPWGLFSHGSRVAAVALFSVSNGFPDAGDPPQMDLGGTSALGTFLGGDSNGTLISSDATLTSTMFPVAPRAGVLFEVSLAIWHSNDDGCTAEADFASGDFRLACPFVAFSIVGAPNPAWGVNVNPVALAD